jgi:deoxyribodipyrimidine photolyase-related protein
MREYRDSLQSLDKTVHYIELTDNKKSYLDNVTDVIRKNKIKKLCFFEPADNTFKEQLYAFLETENLEYEELNNPMFILQKGEFKDLMDGKRLFMADFYKKMRKKLNILMNDDKPIGGKWSFDEENRKK